MQQDDLRKILKNLSVISEAFNRLIGEVKFFIVRAEAQTPQSTDSPADNGGENFTPTKETLKGDTFLAVKEEFMPKIKNIYIYRRKDGYYSATVAVRNVRKTFVNKHKTVAIKKARDYLASILTITPAPISDFNGLAEYYLNNVKKPFISEAYFNTLNGTYLKNPQALYRKVPILNALYDIRADIERGEWRRVNLDELHKAYVDIMGEGRLNFLRHTFQTYCRLFASKEMVNLWTGHSLGADMTDKVYNHIPPEEQLNIANIICY